MQVVRGCVRRRRGNGVTHPEAPGAARLGETNDRYDLLSSSTEQVEVVVDPGGFWLWIINSDFSVELFLLILLLLMSLIFMESAIITPNRREYD